MEQSQQNEGSSPDHEDCQLSLDRSEAAEDEAAEQIAVEESSDSVQGRVSAPEDSLVAPDEPGAVTVESCQSTTANGAEEGATEQRAAVEESSNAVQRSENGDTQENATDRFRSRNFELYTPKPKSKKKQRQEQYRREQEGKKIGEELIKKKEEEQRREEKRQEGRKRRVGIGEAAAADAAAAAVAAAEETAKTINDATVLTSNERKESKNMGGLADNAGSTTAKKHRRRSQQTSTEATTEQITTSRPTATLNDTINSTSTKSGVAQIGRGSETSGTNSKAAQSTSISSSRNETDESRLTRTNNGISSHPKRGGDKSAKSKIPNTKGRELSLRENVPKKVPDARKDFDSSTTPHYQELTVSQSPEKSLLDAVVRRINLYGQVADNSDVGQNQYLRFRQEVIDRGKVVCWICFMKDDRRITERDAQIDCCPEHIRKKWNPLLVWQNRSGSSWFPVRPRHVDSKSTGLFGVCRRGPDCPGPRDCRRPHSVVEKEAWTLDRDGIILKTRPPPRQYVLKLCNNYKKCSKCPHKHFCRYAHGGVELEEWGRFDNKQPKIRVESWRRQVCHELIRMLKIVDSDDVVTDQRQGVEIEKEVYLIDSSEIDSSECKLYEKEFAIDIANEMNCSFKRAALLCGEYFTFVQPLMPGFILSDSNRGMERTNENESENFSIYVKFESARTGSFACDIIFDFGGFPYLVRTLRVEVANTKTVAALKELEWHTRPRDDHWHVEESEIIDCDNRRLTCDTNYRIPDVASLSGKISSLDIVGGSQELTKDRYKPLYHTLLFLEEIVCDAFLHKFSVRNVVLTTDENNRLAGIWTVTLKRPVPPKTAETALVRLSGLDKEHVYAVPVRSVRDVFVELDVSANSSLARVLNDRRCLEIRVDCRFARNSTHFSQLHQSVDNLPESIIKTHLLGAVERTSSGAVPAAPSDLGPEFESNRRQKKAIALILNYSSPLPLIVNGAFGTGKTRLLAEAVRLLTVTRKDIRVLVCTQSNHAADLYVQSFDRSSQESSFRARLMRICYKFRNVGTVPPLVRKYCDEVEGEFVKPSIEEFKEVEDSLVVVTTLITSGQLLDVGLEPGFFTHIVIDEAAQATEPESVTPLALAGSNTVLVLAGDHCQMSPCIQSPWARAGKLHRSLFRRLYKLLRSQSINLTTNYRCNYDIFRITSSLFYDAEDVPWDYCKAPVQEAHPDYHPFSFFAVTDGKAEQKGPDGSYVNLQEASAVIDQVKKILYRWPDEWEQRSDAEVCVIASEYGQVQCIRQLSRSENLSGVSVLTSGSIQGREFQAVVLSTVMTRREYSEEYEREPNFLSNVKILNTAMTRARSLVLVVGDPDGLVRCKIGEKWTRYLEECKDADSLMGAHSQSKAITKIVADASDLNVEAEVFIPKGMDASCQALPSTEIVDTPCTVEPSTDDIEYSRDDCDFFSGSQDSSSNHWHYASDYTSDSDSSMDSESDEDDGDTELTDFDQDFMARKRYYRHHHSEQKMRNLLESEPEHYVRCILTVTSGGENAYGVVHDRSDPGILIEGRRRRNRTFDGEEVLVQIIQKKDCEDSESDSSGGQKRGRVVGVFHRMRPSQFVCKLFENTTNVLIPLDRGQPILRNRSSQRSHEECGGCVVLYGYSKNKRGKLERPEEKRCIGIKEAENKLFIVKFMSWSVYNRYPAGIVTDYVDVGLTYETGRKVLGLQYSIQNNVEEDVKIPPEEACPRLITKAFTIDPAQSEVLDDALALMKYDQKTKVCEVGVFIADVSHFVTKGSSLDKRARDIGMTTYDEKGRQVCPMLPKQLSNDICSLVQDRNRPVLAVFHSYDMETGESIRPARLEKRIIRSCCKMSYEKAQMLIDDQCTELKCRTETRFDLIHDVQILFRLSRRLRAKRLESAMHFRDVDSGKDSLAHGLVEEFMICTNIAIAKQLRECCPEMTPLVCQWEPKQQMIQELVESCGNLVGTSCRLSEKIRTYGISSFQMLTDQSVCPRLHIAKRTFDLIVEAVAEGRSRDIVAAVCTEGFHPQLALANSKFIRSQQKAMYICSANHEESVLRHSDLNSIYTHFTSPIRRYVDLVCHRLVKHHLLRPRKTERIYSEDEMKELCNRATFLRVNMKRYQRELELLQFAHEIHDYPVSTVAVIEKIDSGQIDLFFPYCPHLPARNSRVRLSCLSACACDCTQVNGAPALKISWSIDLLPVGSSRKLELPEYDYCSVSTDLWKQLVSMVSDRIEFTEEGMRNCKDLVDRIDNDRTRSEEEVAARQELLSRTLTANTASDTATGSVEMRRPSECSDGDDGDDDSDDFVLVTSRSARRKQRQDCKTGDDSRSRRGQKRARPDEVVTARAELQLFSLISVQLSSKEMRGLRRPVVQLINFSNGISVCVEHNSYPSDCFADVMSPSALVVSKRQYRDLAEYAKAWSPLVDIESATGSVRNSSTASPVLLYDFDVSWTRQTKGKVKGVATLDRNYVIENKIACSEGDLVCLRYFHVSLPCRPSNEYGDGAPAELLKARSSFNFVCHCRIATFCDRKSDIPSSNVFGKGLASVDQQSNEGESEGDIEKKFEEIIIELIPYDCDSSKRETLLSLCKQQAQCVAQMIHLGLPYKRMNDALEKRIYEVNTDVVTETICGTFDGITSGTKVQNTNTGVWDRGRLSLRSLLNGTLRLNKGQETALELALNQDVTLIQGPPGTGKTVTGVHIACWFAESNKKHANEASVTHGKRQVMYCAPSNEAVDLITKNLMKVIKEEKDHKHLRILRAYGKSIELESAIGPWSFKRYAYVGVPLVLAKEDTALSEVVLHRRIRRPGLNSKAASIIAMEKEFERMKKDGEEPSETQVQDYRDLVSEAEEEEIKAADILLCTCMQTGNFRMREFVNVYQCIVDEAGQCTEPETLIAIARPHLRKIVLIGDHKQLQPVVVDPLVKKQLSISLFERLANAGRAFMLTEQYRMHPSICSFPSKWFYDGKLETPTDIKKRQTKGESLWSRLEGRSLRPKCFIHLDGSEEVNPVAEKDKGGEESKYNGREVAAVLTLVEVMVSRRHRIKQSEIRIITPYTAQKAILESELQRRNRRAVQVSSIAASQGGEADFVILSTVRSLPRDQIMEDPTRKWISDHLGFVTDPHQINVALTRARHGLFILGNRYLLQLNKMWKELIRHYEREDRIISNPDTERIKFLF